MNEKILSSDIISLLEKTVDGSIQNFEVVVRDESGAGKGYLGEMVFVSLTNKKTCETFELVVKQQVATKTAKEEEVMDITFFNEIHFYHNVWKSLDIFQREYPRVKPFDKIPKVYSTLNEAGKRKIVMENLKHLGYDLFPRDWAYDDVQTKFLMESYGRFHATSASFRERNPEVYKKLVDELRDAGKAVTNLEIMKDYLLSCMKQTRAMIDNEEIRAKLNKLCEDGLNIARDSKKYFGKNPVLVHGDCWSNNIMVKNDANGNIQDIRLIDFQLCSSSSVVSDLSYLLYSGASSAVLRNLDHYLKIYHDSFSTVLRNFNLEPSKIFTFDDLKREWKDHCTYGFFLAQMIWYVKMEKGTIDERNLVEQNGDDTEFSEELYKMDELKEALVNLVQHLYDNGYI